MPPENMLACRVRRLRRAELPVDTIELARYLIGKVLVHDLPAGRRSGRIVETEAYVVGDASGHAFRGPTPRNRSLYLEPGHAYVYFVYGTWFMLNVSSELPGIGAGVLLRALEPLDGIAAMRRSRGATRLLDLARGPGRLASAMRITRRQDGADLCDDGALWLGTAEKRAGPIGESTRIGLTREAHRKLRFYERGNPFVSGPKRLRAWNSENPHIAGAKLDIEPAAILSSRFVPLSARASAVKGSFENLSRQQAAAGYSPDSSISTPLHSMEMYLSRADAALSVKDAAAAKKYMDLAEAQLSILERRFGR